MSGHKMRYGMEISIEKSKMMVTFRVTDKEHYEGKADGKVLESADQLVYLGSMLNRQYTSDLELRIRLAIATGQLEDMEWKEHFPSHKNKTYSLIE